MPLKSYKKGGKTITKGGAVSGGAPTYTQGNTRTAPDGTVTQLPDRVATATGSVRFGKDDAERELYAAGQAPNQPKVAGAAEVAQPEQPEMNPVKAVTPTPAEISNQQPAQTPAAQQTPTQKAFQTAKASGMAAPTDGGMARGMVQKFTEPTQGISPIESALEQDEGYTALLDKQREWEDQENQRGTLQQEYERLTKAAGINAINTQLVNMNRVIEGTEDDIRSEVTAASGFATDSQVMAMASARNKSLIQNYNTLLETKNAQMEYVNNMMNFASQDRQYAQQKLQNDMSFLSAQQSYRDKFVNNAKEGYQQVINALGYDALYNSIKGDPKLLANAEKIMGLGVGQLSKLASTTAARRVGTAPQDKILSITEAKELGVPYGTTESQAMSMGITPGSKPSADVENRKQEVLGLIEELKGDSKGKRQAVGASAAKFVPGGKALGFQGKRASFEAKVNTLKSNLTLDNLSLLKGAMSDKDLLFLNSIGSSLDTDMSEKEFNRELVRIQKKLQGTNTGQVAGASTSSTPSTMMFGGKNYTLGADGLYHPQ